VSNKKVIIFLKNLFRKKLLYQLYSTQKHVFYVLYSEKSIVLLWWLLHLISASIRNFRYFFCIPIKKKYNFCKLYMNWPGFIKMLQISLFGVSINITGHVFFVFVQKNFCFDLWLFDFFVPNREFTHYSVIYSIETYFLFQKACHDIFIVRKNQFRKSWKQLLIFQK
jgi:hypothetical protein